MEWKKRNRRDYLKPRFMKRKSRQKLKKISTYMKKLKKNWWAQIPTSNMWRRLQNGLWIPKLTTFLKPMVVILSRKLARRLTLMEMVNVFEPTPKTMESRTDYLRQLSWRSLTTSTRLQCRQRRWNWHRSATSTSFARYRGTSSWLWKPLRMTL